MDDTQSKIIHPSVNDSRVLVYLNQLEGTMYQNTPEEDYLLQLWREI